MTKITQKLFIKACEKSGGNQSTIAQRLSVTRGAITQFLQKYPTMREALETEAERIIDVAENVIDADITNKDSQTRTDSSKWKLLHSKRGKKRGYGPKTDISLEANVNIQDRSLKDINDELNKTGRGNTGTSHPK